MSRALFVVPLLLAACATPYQDHGLTGGLEVLQLDEVTYRIRGDGNGFTRGSTMEEHVLLRAAEIARQRGYTHFALLGSQAGASTGAYTTPGAYSATTTYSGRTATTSGYYAPGVTMPIRFPNHQAVVRMQNAVTDPSGAIVLDASIIYSALAPKYIGR